MKLSKERQLLVEMQIEGYCSEFSPKQTAELRSLYSSMARRGAWKTTINQKHANHMLTLGRFIVKTYLDAYSEEGRIFDANDLPIILAKITSRFSEETNHRALNVPEFSGMSTETVSLLNSVKGILEQDIFIEIKKFELSTKKANSPQLPNTIEENIRKEERVLTRMYLMAGERTAKNIEYYDIAQAEGLQTTEVLHICDRLNAQGFIQIIAMNLAHLTDSGITKIREDILGQQKHNLTKEPMSTIKQADFSFVSDPHLKSIVERDYAELQNLESKKTPKSVLVLSGGIIEGLLLDAIVASGYWTYKDASERFLKEMIYPAKSQGIIQHDNLSEILRVFRNLIHPAREIRDGLNFDESHAIHARAAVDVIVNEVRSWYAKRAATP